MAFSKKKPREVEWQLTNCLECSYSLQGLPDKYVCPECGRKYDKRVLLLRPNSNYRYSRWMLLASVLFVSMVFLQDLFDASGARSLFWKASRIAFGVFAISLVLKYFRRWHSTEYLLLDPTGIAWRERGVDEVVLKWSILGRIEVDEKKDSIVLFGKNEERLGQVPFLFLSKRISATKLVSKIDHFKAEADKSQSQEGA